MSNGSSNAAPPIQEDVLPNIRMNTLAYDAYDDNDGTFLSGPFSIQSDSYGGDLYTGDVKEVCLLLNAFRD